MSAPPITVHAEAVRAYLDTLPPAQPHSRFPGGVILRLNDDHLLGICVPPVVQTYVNLISELQQLPDAGQWEVTLTEYLTGYEHDMEVCHIIRSDQPAVPAGGYSYTADEFFSQGVSRREAPLR